VIVPRASAQSNASLQQLADRYFEAYVGRYPMWATAFGDYRGHDRLDDVSEAAREQWKKTLMTLLRETDRLPAGELSPPDRLTRDLLHRAISDEMLRLECYLHVTPFEPLDGPQVQFPLILVSQPFRDLKDFRAYAARLRAFPQYVIDQIENTRAGVSLGIVSPRVLVEKAIPQIRAHLVKDPKKSEFYAPLQKAAGLSESERETVTAEILDAITGDVIPSYLRLLAFAEDEYLPQCRSNVGIGTVPNGKKIYEALAALHTTTLMKPAETHELGLAEVARISGEMAKIQKEMRFEGNLVDFLSHMRTDPKYRFTNREEILQAADAKLQWSKGQMPKLFNKLPKADCVMKETEAFRAAAAPVAYYNQPPQDGSRPGYYYINTYAPQERLRFTLEALTYHEAVPGHHLQIALDQENTHLPKFRRYASFTAYVEGWALYTEKLGYEIGGYQTPQDRFGQLTFEMWRACRLVVDTGMHFKDWSRAQAIEYMAANTSLAKLDIESEIDRYIAWPGQALAYKIGEIRILQLRREAEKKLGSKFDLRAFHDVLLSEGAMPIDVLENRMKAWVTAQEK